MYFNTAYIDAYKILVFNMWIIFKVLIGCGFGLSSRFARVSGETFYFIYLFFCLLSFLGPYPWHMEVPRLGGRIGTVAAGLHHSSQQCGILNPLSEARDRTCNLMVPNRIHFHCATTGTPEIF